MASHDSTTPVEPFDHNGVVALSDESHDEVVRGLDADARRFVESCDAAIQGQGGRAQTWKVVRGVLGKGLSPEAASKVILEGYNQRCRPPWRDDDILDMCRRAAGKAPKRPPPTDLPDEVLDQAYRAILSSLPLNYDDERRLLARGLSRSEIERLGYKSWTYSVDRWTKIIRRVTERIGADKAFKVPGVVRPESPEFSIRGDGMVVPVRNARGLIVGLRIRQERQVFKKKGGMPALNSDGSPKVEKKYVWLSCRKDHPEDARVRQAAHIALHDDQVAAGTVRLTEGEIKADIATLRTGLLTISVPGVSSWRLGTEAIKVLGATRVRIAFDADCDKNRDVAGAIIESVAELRRSSIGFAIETWPITAGKGIDDVVNAGKVNQIEVLEGDTAQDWLDELARKHGLAGRDPACDVNELFDGIGQASDAPAPAAPAAPENVVNLEAVRATRPREFRRTDLGNAERFVSQHGENIRYCVLWKKWLVWTGQRWCIDDTQQAERWAHETVRSIYAEAGREADLDKRKALVGHAVASESASRITAMLSLAEALVPVRPDEFDKDHWLLNVANGTIDLKTGKLRDHKRSDLITKLAPVTFDPAADRGLADGFLEVVQPDPDVRNYLWRRWGYSLTGDTGEHFIAIDYGSGRNGKSTAANAIQRVLGDYAVQVPTELLLDRPGAHPTDRTTLHGKRFAVATETEEGARLNVSLVKQLTGGDPISARRMREDFWTFLPTHKLTLVTNHKPQIRETKDAIWRRVHLIPWAVQIAEGKEDKTLAERLPGPGLLRALVEGCLDYQQRKGLVPPKAVVAATQAYRGESDLLGGFIEEHLVADAKAELEFKALYSLYKSWAEEGGHKPMSQKRLTGDLDERGLGTSVRSTKTGRMVRVGVKQRLQASPEDDDAAWEEQNPSILQPGPSQNPQESCGTEGSEGSEGRFSINSLMEPREVEIRDLPSNPSILQNDEDAPDDSPLCPWGPPDPENPPRWFYDD